MKTYPFLIGNIKELYGTWSKPDGSRAFVMTEEDQRQYPRFTELVKNLSTYVSQKPKVLEKLMEYSHLSESFH